MTSRITIAAATFATFFALAAADHSPPAWMWALLTVVNLATLALALRNRRAHG